MTNFVSRDFDAAAVAAILDPQKANDDQYYRFYGKRRLGPTRSLLRKACACASTG